MKTSIAVCGLALWLSSQVGLVRASDHESAVTPAEAIHRLQEGNVRFSEGHAVRLRGDCERRAQTATRGQHPFVTILSCSDSRVPLELVFDQGIGDIFVIRVAGNVCGTDEMGSIEYGVDHLGTPLLVVLGHTQCGAVTAAATEAEVHDHLKPLVEKIAPAVSKARAAHPDLRGEALVPAGTEANVWQAAEELLKNSPATRHRVQAGKLKLVGAIYDVRSGQVRWLGEHPQQNRLLGSRNQASTRPASH